jgi:hypothetical protein
MEAAGSSRQWQPLAPRTTVSQDLSFHDPNCPLSGILPNSIPAFEDGNTRKINNRQLGGGYSTGKAKEGPAILEGEPPSRSFISLIIAESLEGAKLDYGEDYGLSCNACKQRFRRPSLNQPLDKKASTIVLNTQRLKKQSTLSPHEILGSGRSDPFLTFPVEKPSTFLNQLMDFGKSIRYTVV